MKKIKRISVLKNVLSHNDYNNIDNFSKKGVMVVEYEDNSRHILDLECNADITDCDYIKTKVIQGKTKVKDIFYDEFLNEE